jgi:hypothetical protein
MRMIHKNIIEKLLAKHTENENLIMNKGEIIDTQNSNLSHLT